MNIGEEYLISFVPTFTGVSRPKVMKYVELQDDKYWFIGDGRIVYLTEEELPKRCSTVLQIKGEDICNVVETEDLNEISKYLESKAAHTWGQGEITCYEYTNINKGEKFKEMYLLSFGSPTHKDWKRCAIVCSMDNYNKAIVDITYRDLIGEKEINN